MRVASRAIAIWAVLLGGSVGYLHLQNVRAADPQSVAPAPPAAASDPSSSSPDIRAALDQVPVSAVTTRGSQAAGSISNRPISRACRRMLTSGSA